MIEGPVLNAENDEPFVRTEAFGPDGYQKSDSDAERPGRFAAIGVRFRY